MFKKRDPEADGAADDRDSAEERAYEDSWYRSLKAMAETRTGERSEDDAEAEDQDEEEASGD